MSHWIIVPIILPAVLAPFIVLAARYHIGIQRAFSVAGVMALIAIAAGLAWEASDGTVTLYQTGDWAAPFGIVVVGDRLSTMMVLLTSVLALFVLLYAIGSKWDERGRHFHALFQFQLMGILGAFLTGDLFNLFVFFEVLLIASYGLMIHSGGDRRLRAGVQYVLFNLLGSTLFLFALGAIYAETGTLNMADLAQRVTLIDPAASVAARLASCHRDARRESARSRPRRSSRRCPCRAAEEALNTQSRNRRKPRLAPRGSPHSRRRRRQPRNDARLQRRRPYPSHAASSRPANPASRPEMRRRCPRDPGR